MSVSRKKKTGNEILKGFVEVSHVKNHSFGLFFFLSPTFPVQHHMQSPVGNRLKKPHLTSFCSIPFFFSFLEWSQMVEIKVLNRQQSLLTNSRTPLICTILITLKLINNYMGNFYKAKEGGVGG